MAASAYRVDKARSVIMASPELYQSIRPFIFIFSVDLGTGGEICEPGMGPKQFGPLILHFIKSTKIYPFMRGLK
jgi:hypothetical protein